MEDFFKIFTTIFLIIRLCALALATIYLPLLTLLLHGLAFPAAIVFLTILALGKILIYMMVIVISLAAMFVSDSVIRLGETACLEKIIQKLTSVFYQKHEQEFPRPKIDISRVNESQQETRSVADNSTVPGGEQEPVAVIDISTVAEGDPRFPSHLQDLIIESGCVLAFEEAGAFANDDFGFDIDAIADDPHPLSFEYSLSN